MRSDCIVVIVSSFYTDLCIRTIFQACFFQNENRNVVPSLVLLPTRLTLQQKRHSTLTKDLSQPPTFLKASPGFPNGNFYTSWHVAHTPGLRKTPNDD